MFEEIADKIPEKSTIIIVDSMKTVIMYYFRVECYSRNSWRILFFESLSQRFYVGYSGFFLIENPE